MNIQNGMKFNNIEKTSSAKHTAAHGWEIKLNNGNVIGKT